MEESSFWEASVSIFWEEFFWLLKIGNWSIHHFSLVCFHAEIRWIKVLLLPRATAESSLWMRIRTRNKSLAASLLPFRPCWTILSRIHRSIFSAIVSVFPQKWMKLYYWKLCLLFEIATSLSKNIKYKR